MAVNDYPMKSFRPVILLAMLAVSPFLSTVRAVETNAAVPYQNLDDMLQPISKIDSSKLEVMVFVRSTNHGVSLSNITLNIHSATKGMIPVDLNTNARIIHFPHDDALVKENPPVVSNLPKGAMRLAVFIKIPLTNALAFRYNRLGDGVAEMNKAMKRQAGWAMALLVPKIKGVVFYFPRTNAADATVEVASTSGLQKFTADQRGQIKLPLDAALLKENPEVRLSVKPQLVVPDMSELP